ncbi:MAG: DegV family protein [Clostridia bacterium]|nr:DegV family protein [Clostridia bacterium]
MDEFKIVADSSADVYEIENGEVPFASAALKIITADREYTDDKMLDVRAMVDELSKYKGKSSTSCPNPEDWLAAFGQAKEVFCVTITSTLSGSYNAACIAKEIYEECYPERRVFVIDTLSAGPEMRLIIEKICELRKKGCDFEEICQKTVEYSKGTKLLFMLKSMKNLANNGRVSHLSAKAAGVLGICVVGKASDRGELEPLNKCRGEDKAIGTILNRMKEFGFNGKKVCIAHCFEKIAAAKLRSSILQKYPDASVEMYNCGGLCSFYAEKGGMLIGFEA